ncbi:MAG TPA: PAS domain S-box protein [Gallionella sp.]|nr:PAS domain S-box protein [Gallionella sp.]
MKAENIDTAKTKQHTRTILLIDDSPVNLGVVVHNLEAIGYDVLVALDGEEALERIELARPDLILLDVMMPGIDGFEVCRRLKAQAHTRDIPVIFMTSLSSIDDKVQGFEAGAVDYVTKPLQFDEVRVRVGTHLKLRELQRRLEENNRELQLEVAERKRMAEELSAREREFRSLADNLPDNIARWDTRGRILYSNPTHQRTLGKLANELLGKTHSEVFPDGRFSRGDDAIARIVASGKPEFLRETVSAENGEIRIHDINFVPEFDESGRIVSVLGLGRDMTEIYRMQDAIAAREHEFRSLAESSPDFIVRYDRDGHHRYLNATLVNLLGLHSTAEVIGRRSSEIWPDGRFDKIDQAAEQAVESGSTQIIELTVPGKNGSIDYHQICVVPERDVAGTIVGTIAFGRDITAIREAERRLTHFIDNLPGIAYTFKVAPDGRWSFPYISPSIHDYYGLQPEDVRDDAAPLHTLAHPADQPRIEAAIAESQRAMTPLRFEFRVCRPGLLERWLEIHSMPDRQADGSILWYGIMLDITGRKRMEQAQKESEASYRHHFNLLQSIFESSPKVGIYALDREYRYLAFNSVVREGVKRLWGADISIGMSMLDDAIDNDEHRKICKQGFDYVLAGNSFFLESKEAKLKDGKTEYEYHDNYSSPIYNDAGEVIGLTVFVTNITERKRIEEQLKLKEFALDRAHEAAYLMDEDGLHFVYVNEAACRSLGYSREELLSLTLPDIDPYLSPDEAQAIGEKLLADGSVTLESRHRRRDGSSFPVEIQTSAFEHQGRTLSLALVRDITERKQAERQLKESLAFSEGVINAIPDILLEVDRHGRYLNVWTKSPELLAAQKEALLGKTVHEVLSPEGAAIAMDCIRETEAQGFSFGKVIRIDLPHGERWFEHSASIKPGGTPSDTRFLVLSRDITERKRVEYDLEESRAQLRGLVSQREAAREEERKHIAREVHDNLGQILSGLRLNVSRFSRRHAANSAEMQQQLQETGELIELAVSEVRNISAALRPVELDMDIRSALASHLDRFSAYSGIACKLHADNDVALPGEEHSLALFRIVQEALTNVARHAQADSVDVKLGMEPPHCVLNIRDNGTGFDANIKKSKSFGLVGIRERTAMLGGSVVIDSYPGKGTEITVHIPVRDI